VDGSVATAWGRGVERREEWRRGSGRPPQPAKSARRGTPVAPSRDAPILESRVGTPGG
jgi:hypothetical protein